ncbi:hypothetical protein K438DRAFT_244977 [Mycena galopus ATCC 62051]|nr:hypothetical protein K438DRAFT_244977 [Mycena galopus ATCC 62051]
MKRGEYNNERPRYIDITNDEVQCPCNDPQTNGPQRPSISSRKADSSTRSPPQYLKRGRTGLSAIHRRLRNRRVSLVYGAVATNSRIVMSNPRKRNHSISSRARTASMIKTIIEAVLELRLL